MRVILEESFLRFCCLIKSHLLFDLLLAPAPDYHVALFKVDDFIMDNVNHQLLCAFVHQIRLGQNT